MNARVTRTSASHDLLCKHLDLVGVQGYTREHRAIPGRQFRIDIAFPELKLAIEVMGGTWSNGRHTRGAGYEADCEKACLLAGLGWRYLPVTSEQVRSGKALKWIEKALRGTT